jgi:hypothetical protein
MLAASATCRSACCRLRNAAAARHVEHDGRVLRFVVEAVAEIREPLDFHDASSPMKRGAPPVMALDHAKALSHKRCLADGWFCSTVPTTSRPPPQADAAQRKMRELTAKLALLLSKKQELVCAGAL